MSDATLPPDDELVSAHLDGEATPAESARVVGDPAAAAHARELAAVQELVATPVTPPSDQREAAIAAALDLYDQLSQGTQLTQLTQSTPTSAAPADHDTEAGASPPATHVTPVPSVADDELAARRAAAASKARRAGRNGKILAVAAVVVVALLGLGAVLRLQTSESKDTALSSAAAPTTTARNGAASSKTQNDAATQQEQPTAAGGNASTTAPTAPPTTTAGPVTTSVRPAPVVPDGAPSRAATEEYRFREQSLGTFSTPAQVRASVISTLAGPPGAASTVPSASAPESAAAAGSLAGVQRCDAAIRTTDTEVGPIVLSAPATYKGTSALVLVYSIDRVAHPAANGGSRIYTVDATSCAVLDVQTG
jgi:hypothetical protein